MKSIYYIKDNSADLYIAGVRKEGEGCYYLQFGELEDAIPFARKSHSLQFIRTFRLSKKHYVIIKK